MRTTLEIDDDVARVEAEDGLPVIHVPAGTPPITPEMVRRALDERDVELLTVL